MSELLDVISKNGGHLAPNMGVVELTIALHSVFNAPKDKLIWDVGHQGVSHFGWGDQIIPHGTICAIRRKFSMDAKSIADEILKRICNCEKKDSP